MEDVDHVDGEGTSAKNSVPDQQTTDNEATTGNSLSLRKVFQWDDVAAKLRNDVEIQKWEKCYEEAMSDHNQVSWYYFS